MEILPDENVDLEETEGGGEFNELSLSDIGNTAKSLKRKKNNKVLFVGDKEETIQIYRELFKNANMEIVWAKDGVEALDLAMKTEGVGLIFTDLDLARMDGLTFIQTLKNYPSTRDLPVIVNTFNASAEDEEEAIKLGVKEFYIQGTVSYGQILKTIGSLLDQGVYKLRVDFSDLDGSKFVKNLEGLNPNQLRCKDCGADLALFLTLKDNDLYKAEIACPKCV